MGGRFAPVGPARSRKALRSDFSSTTGFLMARIALWTDNPIRSRPPTRAMRSRRSASSDFVRIRSNMPHASTRATSMVSSGVGTSSLKMMFMTRRNTS